MNGLLVTENVRSDETEVFGELPGPRGIIVCSLHGSGDQRSAVTCKGSFPFPFQADEVLSEWEVKSSMQTIDFYCRKCRKSMKMSYSLCGDDDAAALSGIMIRCHTRKCTRVVTFRSFKEGQIRRGADASGKYYL